MKIYNKMIVLVSAAVSTAAQVSYDDDDDAIFTPPEFPPALPDAATLDYDPSKPYVAVDAGGEWVSYEWANDYCKNQVGTALASVYKNSNKMSQKDQITKMSEMCDTATQANTCWTGLQWVDSEHIFRWENGEYLTPSASYFTFPGETISLTNWESDDDWDGLGDAATPTAQRIVSGGNMKCVVLSHYYSFNWKNYPCSTYMSSAESSSEATAFLCDNPNFGVTDTPTTSPTANPTNSPTKSPTNAPTANPTNSPTKSPTNAPTSSPTTSPASRPTESPTNPPTAAPTVSPTSGPTESPTTSAPTATPTAGLRVESIDFASKYGATGQTIGKQDFFDIGVQNIVKYHNTGDDLVYVTLQGKTKAFIGCTSDIGLLANRYPIVIEMMADEPATSFDVTGAGLQIDVYEKIGADSSSSIVSGNSLDLGNLVLVDSSTIQSSCTLQKEALAGGQVIVVSKLDGADMAFISSVDFTICATLI